MKTKKKMAISVATALAVLGLGGAVLSGGPEADAPGARFLDVANSGNETVTEMVLEETGLKDIAHIASSSKISDCTLEITSGENGSNDTWRKNSGSMTVPDNVTLSGKFLEEDVNGKETVRDFSVTYALNDEQMQAIYALTGLTFDEKAKAEYAEKHGPGAAPLHGYTVDYENAAIGYAGNYKPQNMAEYNPKTMEYSTEQSTKILSVLVDGLDEAYEQGELMHFTVGEPQDVVKKSQKLAVKTLSVSPITGLEDGVVTVRVQMVKYDKNNMDAPAQNISFNVTFGPKFLSNPTEIFGGPLQMILEDAKYVILEGKQIASTSGPGYSAYITDWEQSSEILNSNYMDFLDSLDDKDLELESRVKQMKEQEAGDEN